MLNKTPQAMAAMWCSGLLIKAAATVAGAGRVQHDCSVQSVVMRFAARTISRAALRAETSSKQRASSKVSALARLLSESHKATRYRQV